jgi:hypothetical protein
MIEEAKRSWVLKKSLSTHKKENFDEWIKDVPQRVVKTGRGCPGRIGGPE